MACKPPDLTKLAPQDYYLEDGKVVFTEVRHLRRGHCCGNGCRHCPYFPQHTKGVTGLREKAEFPLDWLD